MSAQPEALPISSINHFSECLYGGKGALDAWLECNNEAEVRAHIKAYAEASAAAELRRLRAFNAQMLEALESVVRQVEPILEKQGFAYCGAIQSARAAIAAAKEQR